MDTNEINQYNQYLHIYHPCFWHNRNNCTWAFYSVLFMNFIVSPTNSYVEALISMMTAFRDSAFKEITKFKQDQEENPNPIELPLSPPEKRPSEDTA